MNLPTDLVTRMQLGNSQEKRTRDRWTALERAGGPAKPNDLLRLQIGNVPFKYETKGYTDDSMRITSLNIHGIVDVPQGKLVCLVGPHRGGKSTVLSLLGGTLLPAVDMLTEFSDAESGKFFVPSHLRVLQVASEPLFLEGTLCDNLVFGVRNDDPDSSVERVREILT